MKTETGGRQLRGNQRGAGLAGSAGTIVILVLLLLLVLCLLFFQAFIISMVVFLFAGVVLIYGPEKYAVWLAVGLVIVGLIFYLSAEGQQLSLSLAGQLPGMIAPALTALRGG
jgi:hypothetical protein